MTVQDKFQTAGEGLRASERLGDCFRPFHPQLTATAERRQCPARGVVGVWQCGCGFRSWQLIPPVVTAGNGKQARSEGALAGALLGAGCVLGPSLAGACGARR
jgi:hypothetical protein